MRSHLRWIAVLSLLTTAAFAAGAGCGFVYTHEPQPDRVVVRVSAPVPPTEKFVAGTIVTVEQKRITVRTEADELAIEIPTRTPIEELLSVAPADIAIGAPVNIGGKPESEGLVLTGVVTFAEQGLAP